MSVFVNPDSPPENQALGALIQPLAQFPKNDPRRKQYVLNVRRALAEDSTIAKWCANLTKRYYLQDEREDVQQIVEGAIVEVLYSVTAPDVESFRALYLPHLYGKARHAVMTYQESADRTGVSGMTAVNRRRKQIVKARAELSSNGEQPTDREVMDHINAKMRERRTNPERQGALITESDFQSSTVISTDDVNEAGSTVYDRAVQAESDEYSVDMRLAMDSAVRSLMNHIRTACPGNRMVMRCVTAWMRLQYEGVTPGPRHIAEEAGCTLRDAREAITVIERELQVFREVQEPQIA